MILMARVTLMGRIAMTAMIATMIATTTATKAMMTAMGMIVRY
jgi:hypothetical protein